MSVANRLYDVSHGKTSGIDISNLPVLYVDGAFSAAIVGAAYEGRLQIHNNVGACTVKLLSGDLPNGYGLVVDNTTLEVVLTWPARTFSSVIPNPNFAEGDVGWNKGPGWSIVEGDNTLDPDDPGNSWEGLFVHQIGESALMSQYFVPAIGGKTYTASIDVQTGKAREHSHGAAVRLLFYDASGNKIPGGADGNVVKQTTGNTWAKSTVSVKAPDLAQYISGGFAAYRMHQDYALWVDNFQWNVEGSDVGTDTPETINLSLQVEDSLGRIADWSGTVVIRTLISLLVNSSGSSVYYSNDGFQTITSSGIASYTVVNTVNGFIARKVSDGKFYKSTDGFTWDVIDGGTIPNPSVQSMGYINGALLVVCDGNGIYRSADGAKTWTRVSSNTNATKAIFTADGMCLCYAGGGGNPLQSLDDGATWGNSSGLTNGPLCLIKWGEDYYVGTALNGQSTSQSLYKYNPSTNTWSSIPSLPAGFNYISGLAVVGNTLYIGTYGVTGAGVFSTTDLSTFTNISSNTSANATKLYGSKSGLLFMIVTNPYQLVDGVFVKRQNITMSGQYPVMAFADS